MYLGQENHFWARKPSAMWLLWGVILSLWVGSTVQAHAQTPSPQKNQSDQGKQVVVTLTPLASLVRPFLQPHDQLTVLLPPGRSPHGFSFRPSQRLAIAQADVLLSVGTGADQWANEAFAQALKQRPGAQWLRMADSASVVLSKRALRPGAADSKPPQKGAVRPAAAPKAHTPKADGHLWLSPQNAKAFIDALASQAQVLARGRDDWEARHQDALAALAAKQQQLQHRLEPVQGVAYLVLHDAYQYFEHAFGLNFQGAVQLSPVVKPSVSHIMALRDRMQTQGIRCVFKDKQFPERQLAYVTRGLEVKTGILDPLGHGLWPSDQAVMADTTPLPYTRLLTQLADAFEHCLVPK